MPPSAASEKKKTRQKATSDTQPHFVAQCFGIFVNLIAKVGIIGTIIIVILYTFQFCATIEQKREFINKFILWKFPKDEINQFYYLGVILIALNLITYVYLKKQIKLKNEKIEFLTKENERLLN